MHGRKRHKNTNVMVKANLPVLRPENHLPAALVSFFRDAGFMAIALSGGIDSRFLCHAATLCSSKFIAVHVSGPHIAQDESNFARLWAYSHKLKYLDIHFNPIELPDINNNSPRRCYACKKALLSAIVSSLAQKGLHPDTICDGGNRDDYYSYRPGIRAVAEFGVKSPLALASLGKREIYGLAEKTGLDFPRQKARPCMLTRLAYGMKPLAEILRQIAQAESAIQNFLDSENLDAEPDFRLRLAPEPVLHVNMDVSALAAKLKVILATHGFPLCKIETLEKLSGYFDQQ